MTASLRFEPLTAPMTLMSNLFCFMGTMTKGTDRVAWASTLTSCTYFPWLKAELHTYSVSIRSTRTLKQVKVGKNNHSRLLEQRLKTVNLVKVFKQDCPEHEHFTKWDWLYSWLYCLIVVMTLVWDEKASHCKEWYSIYTFTPSSFWLSSWAFIDKFHDFITLYCTYTLLVFHSYL